MYRKSLEMDASGEQERQQCDGEFGNFIDRVAQLPLVRSAVNTTLNVVKKAKESNGLFDYTLTNAINTALFAAEKAKPVVYKFEVPIGYVDILACKTLDKLEQTAPIITKTPEEIVNESRKVYEENVVKPALAQYNNIKNYGLGKVNAIKGYGVQTATDLANTKYGHFVIDKVDGLIVKVDCYVDEYLPKSPEVFDDAQQEPEPKLDSNVDTIEKAVFVSRKLRQRLYHHGLLKLEVAKKRTDAILANLNVVLEMARNVKSNLDDRNKALRDHFQQLWEETAKNAAAGAELETVEQRILYLAQQLTSQLRSTYQKVAITLNYFPKTLQEKVDPTIKTVNVYIADLYTQLAKTKSFDEVSDVVSAQLNEALKKLELACAAIYEAAVQRRPLSWMDDDKDKLSNGSAVQCDGRTDASSAESDKEDSRQSFENEPNKSSNQYDYNEPHACDHNDTNRQQNCTSSDCWKTEDENRG
ncbi:Protein LSD1 [Chamberlinius hualienensis]